MNWINKKTVSVLSMLLLVGCAGQKTIMPAGGAEMVDIYRGALDKGDSDNAVHASEAAELCAAVGGRSTKKCMKKVKKILDSRLVLERNPNSDALDYVPYTRTEVNEIDNLFPRHRNPDLVIYVYPHLATRSRAPIPGYTTVIPLYDRVQYRLPGEVAIQK